MARIPVRKEGQRLAQINPVQGESPGAARRGGTNIANAAQATGRAAGAIGDYLERKDKVNTRLFEKEIKARSEQVYQEGFFKANQDKRLEPDGSNLMELYKEHTSDFNNQIGQMPAGLNKRIAQTVSLGVSNGFTGKVFNNMMTFDAAHKAKRTEDYKESMLTSVMSNPGTASVDEANNNFKGYVDALGLDPVTKAKVLDEFKESSDMAVAQGHSSQGNYGEAIEHVMQSDSFSPKEKIALTKDIRGQQLTVSQAAYTRDTRIRTRNREALADHKEDFEQDVMLKLIDAGKDADEIAKVENYIDLSMRSNPSLANKSTRTLLKGFKDPERKQVQDEFYMDYNNRMEQSRDLDTLEADMNASVGNRDLDPRDAATIMMRMRANKQKGKSDPSWALSKKAAEALLNATIEPEFGDFGNAFYKGDNLQVVAGIRHQYSLNVKKGWIPYVAMRKALVSAGKKPRVVVRNVPIDMQAGDKGPENMRKLKTKILSDNKKGLIKGKENRNRAAQILKDIPLYLRRHKSEAARQELIKMDKEEGGK